MSRMSDDWLTQLVKNARRTTVRHRNNQAVLRFTIVAVALLLAGLIARLWDAPLALRIMLYGGAVLTAAALMMFLFSKRLRVTRPPKR